MNATPHSDHKSENNNDILLKNVDLLSKLSKQEVSMMPATEAPLPSVEQVKQIVSLVKNIIFPDYFNQRQPDEKLRSYNIGVHMQELARLLVKQIAHGLQFCEDCENTRTKQQVYQEAERLAMEFIDTLPEIKRLLYTDVQAMFDNDPAARNYGEVIFCYPVVNTMTHYRIAHKLHELNVPVIPRIITEQAHSKTGIDIHPGAQIGHHFTIDHGTGVVIGATCIIGNYVKLYQGVTLGAKSFTLDDNGNPIKGIPRHPILEDNVIVYSNATVLGRITLAQGTVIGGNVWVTESTKPGEQIVQAKKRKSQLVRPEDWGCL